jgi:hypothetical protein
VDELRAMVIEARDELLVETGLDQEALFGARDLVDRLLGVGLRGRIGTCEPGGAQAACEGA